MKTTTHVNSIMQSYTHIHTYAHTHIHTYTQKLPHGIENFNEEDYTCEQHHAISHDGVRVPLTIARKKSAKGTGPRPVLMEVYGSYGQSLETTWQVCMYVDMYAYIYVCVHTYTHFRSHIHTYIHTCTGGESESSR